MQATDTQSRVDLVLAVITPTSCFYTAVDPDKPLLLLCTAGAVIFVFEYHRNRYVVPF